MSELERSVESLKAAGEPTRLRILALLASGELTVKDFTDILGQSQPRISRHLKLLVDAGLVERHAEGAWAYFRMAGRDQDEGKLAHFAVAQVGTDDPQVKSDREALTALRDAQQSNADLYFSKVAHEWDGLRKIHAPEAVVEQRIKELVGAAKVPHLLDLGTGTGRMLELLAQNYEQGVGIDASREMLAVARSKLNTPATAHAQVRLGDVLALDASADKADLVLLHQVLHYFDDPQQILAQAGKVLAEKGRMLVVDFAPHALAFLRDEHAHRRLGLSQEQMAAWCAATGLQVTQFDSIPPSKEQKDALTVCLWMIEKAAE